MQPEKIPCDKIITYTYSPNWYRPQCLAFMEDGNCYYCSNYTIYQYSTSQRAIIKDLSIRSIALSQKQMGINSKNMKIQCLTIFTGGQDQILVAGLNQPYLIFINAASFQLIKIMKMEKFENGISGIVGIPGSDQLIIWNEDDSVVHLSGSKHEVISSLTAPEKIKDIRIVEIDTKLYVFLVTNRGQIQIIDTSLKIHTTFTGQQLNFSNHILSMDVHIEANKITIGVLSRNKATLNFVSQYTIEYRKQQQQFALVTNQQTINIELKTIYPKVFAEKLKKNYKAAMTLKMLNSTQLILTGKLGELFVVNLAAFVASASKKENYNQVMVIKPHTMEDIEDWLYICDDSKHYKQIYGVYLCRASDKTRMFMVGTDQILSEWELDRFKGNVDFRSLSTLKFLTSEVQSFFHCEADPKIIYVLLRDGIVRSCSPLSPVSYYLQEYWKFTKKFKVLKCVAHPIDSGILGFVTECGKILLYDVLEDRLMRIIEIDKNKTGKNIINITFESETIMRPIELLETAMNKQGTEEKRWKKCEIKVNGYYQREEAKDIGVLVQLLDKFVFIGHSYDTDQLDDKKTSKYAGFEMKRYCKVQRIHNTKLWDQESMIFSQSKAGVLKTWIIFNSKIGYFETKLNYNSSRSIFKLVSTADHKLLLIFEFKNKKLMLTTINLKNIQFQSDLDAIGKEIKPSSTNEEDEIQKVELESPIHIEQMVLDYWANQLIVYNQKEDILGYLDFQPILSKAQNDQLSSKFECLGVSSKIETVSFYEQTYLAMGFKDQSIKIIPISHLRTEVGYQGPKNHKEQQAEKEEDWVDCD